MRRKFVVSKWYEDRFNCFLLSTLVFKSMDSALDYLSSIELKKHETLNFISYDFKGKREFKV